MSFYSQSIEYTFTRVSIRIRRIKKINVVRHRQHVNPLSQFFQVPFSLPDKATIFEQPQYPIHIDIGSARGNFLIELAAKYPMLNFLGLEIREPLVISAEKKRNQLGLTNLKFIFCNVNVSLEQWLINLDQNQLQRVSIQFPDPWFKRKHFKRRVLQPYLLNTLAGSFPEGGEIFIQSDILEVIEAMIEVIDSSCYFDRKLSNGIKWLDKNPYDIYTEREIYALERDLPIYRAMYFRNSKSFINASINTL